MTASLLSDRGSLSSTFSSTAPVPPLSSMKKKQISMVNGGPHSHENDEDVEELSSSSSSSKGIAREKLQKQQQKEKKLTMITTSAVDGKNPNNQGLGNLMMKPKNIAGGSESGNGNSSGNTNNNSKLAGSIDHQQKGFFQEYLKKSELTHKQPPSSSNSNPNPVTVITTPAISSSTSSISTVDSGSDLSSSINSNNTISTTPTNSATAKTTLLLDDSKPYTIPPSIAENVMREMLANKPDPVVLEQLRPVAQKSSSSSSTLMEKGNGGSIDSLLGSKSKSHFPSKFSFPNIADKNFFVPNFTTNATNSNSSSTINTPNNLNPNPSIITVKTNSIGASTTGTTSA
ncbi:1938_t:CDS:2, partial [Ambispora leptoticha]